MGGGARAAGYQKNTVRKKIDGIKFWHAMHLVPFAVDAKGLKYMYSAVEARAGAGMESRTPVHVETLSWRC